MDAVSVTAARGFSAAGVSCGIKADQALDLAVTFVEGEEIHTEVSCKFTHEGVENDFRAAGMQLDQWLTDSQNRFALAVASHA